MRRVRTKLERARDLALIARLALEGHDQNDIARSLGLSQPQVSRSLAKLEAEWLREGNKSFANELGFLLAALDHLEQTAWQAFELSMERSKKTIARSRPGESRPRSVKTIRRTRDGSPAFLTVVFGCKLLRAELQGLYPAKPGKPHWREEGREDKRDGLELLQGANYSSILLELERRNGVIEVWMDGPPPPRPEDLPPGFQQSL